MDIMKIVNQAKDLIFNPQGTMKKLKDEKVELKDIIFYLAVVAFPLLLGNLLGYGIIWGGGSYIGWGFAIAIISYIGAIIGVVIFGFILNMLAPSFKTKQNQMQAFKLVSYAATPWLLLGIINIFPAAGIIAFLGLLYGLYILYLGIPILMETPKEQQMIFFIIGLVVYIIVGGLISFITGWIWTSLFWSSFYTPGWGYPY